MSLVSQGEDPSKNKELYLRPYFIPKLKTWYVGLICTTYLVLVFFLGVRPFSPSPLKSPLPMIGIWCVIIFAGTNFWLDSIHSLREPSLSPPEAPHKLLEYREKECLRALERKQKKTLERVECTIRGTWYFTLEKNSKNLRELILKRDSVRWHSIETVLSLNHQWQGEKAKSPIGIR